MWMRERRVLLALGFIVLLSVSVLYLTFPFPSNASCGQRIGLAKLSKFNLSTVHFDAVTKFGLPASRFPNSIVADGDGSVWFGEQAVPGVAHLLPNGTLIEYAWPVTYSPSTTSIWGIAKWNDEIWASDALGSQLVGLDTSTAAVYVVKVSGAAGFPYTVTVGPDDSLWFTELFVSRLGRIDSRCTLKEYPVPIGFGGTPTQIAFQNNSLGYYVDAGNASTGLGTLLSFDPNRFLPQPFGGASTLRAPSSLAVFPTGIWVAQHASANLAFYDMNTHRWTFFPTSPVSYEETTLPYFVAANGTQIWFNEHYANRMAMLDTQRGLLTEYSLSNPPANKVVRIDNALTLALDRDKAWFTELTANYVGYVDAGYKPSFTLTQPNNASIKLKPGEDFTVAFTLKGHSSVPLTINFADSENLTGRLSKLRITANFTEAPSLDGKETIIVRVVPDRTLPAGTYVLLVTISDGLINQGAYLTLRIA
jgi:streptogramin lyase